MPSLKTIIFLIFCPFLLNGQNIIPNGSFTETYQANFGITKAVDWESPTNGSPDFMHPKSRAELNVPKNLIGVQNAKKGQGYFGLLAYSKNPPGFREYIQSKLLQSLKKDSIYCFQMHISLADSVLYATSNSIEILFSSQKISNQNTVAINLSPSISFYDSTYFDNKTDWIQLSSEYTANGTEKYIILGNFDSDSLSDTNQVSGGKKDWYRSAYYYVDDIFLGSCDSVPLDTPTGITENSLLSKIKGYPNSVTDLFVLENNSQQPLSFQLYNLMGQSMELANGASSEDGSSSEAETPHRYELSMGHLPKGIYLLQVVGRNERATIKIVKE